MIVIDTQQGSGEWFELRRGIPTGSDTSRICTSKGVRSTQRTDYLHELVAERITGKDVGEGHQSEAMLRGTALEPEARAWYQFETEQDVAICGFIFADKSKRFGVSPDGITTTGGLEIKCRGQKQHIATLLRGRPQSSEWMQMQASMYASARSTWDYVAYHDDPSLPNVIWTIDSDEQWIDAFKGHLEAFCDDVDAAEAKVRAMA